MFVDNDLQIACKVVVVDEVDAFEVVAKALGEKETLE
jgi:hypothetical protein